MAPSQGAAPPSGSTLSRPLRQPRASVRASVARAPTRGHTYPQTRNLDVYTSTLLLYLRPQLKIQKKKIRNLSSCGVRVHPKTANYGLVVEYMDRAQGPKGDFFSQNLRGTHTNPIKSECTSPRPLRFSSLHVVRAMTTTTNNIVFTQQTDTRRGRYSGRYSDYGYASP